MLSRAARRVGARLTSLGTTSTDKGIIDEAGRIAARQARAEFNKPWPWSPYLIRYEWGSDQLSLFDNSTEKHYGLVLNMSDPWVYATIAQHGPDSLRLEQIAIDAFQNVISDSVFTKHFLQNQLENLIHGH